MKKKLVTCVILLSVYLLVIEARFEVDITHFEICTKKQGSFKLYAHITKADSKHYMHYNATVPYPLGTNVGTTIDGNKYVTIHKIREKCFCKAAYVYLGGLWDGLLRSANIPEKACPIPKGYYHANDVEMEFDNVATKNLPFGNFRMILGIFNNSNPRVELQCILVDIKSTRV